MKRILCLLCIAAAPATSAEPERGIDGLLGFTNGDQLHGSYVGFSENRLGWLRGDLANEAEFDLPNIRRVVLRGGRPESQLKRQSHAATIYGDRIPGSIVLVDDEKAVIGTEFAGNIEIPRGHLGMLAPNPFGGIIFYQGPFSADDWRIVEVGERNRQAEQNEDDSGVLQWTHSGLAWYWPGQGNADALVLDRELPESVLMRFEVSWKSRISLSLAFHADFKPVPEPEAEEEVPVRRRRVHFSDTSIFSEVFGNAYILQLNPSHALLFRSTIDEHGVSRVERMHTNFNNVNLGESGKGTVEIRASRPSGEISLFINDEYVAQWSEIGFVDGAADEVRPYAGKGGGFGLMVQSPNTSIRISDIVIAEWNGMPDAARSMQTADHDIVLLGNGTDRFSGKVVGISDDKVTLAGRYGDFTFPLAEVAEIRFARNSLARPEAAPSNTVGIRLHPLGLVRGIPIAGDVERLRINHPSSGAIEIDMSPVVVMEMQSQESFLDAWDPEF